MPDIPLNGIDIAVAAVVLISALVAFFRGFVHEVLAVAGWVGAIFATIYGLSLAKPYARQLISINWVADVVAGTVIFVATLIVFSLITGFIARRVQESVLNVLDRSLGFLFGVARGAVLVCLAYIAVEWMASPPEQPAWLRSARTIRLIEAGAELLKALVPRDAAAGASGLAADAQENTRKALETQRILRDILSPEPKRPEPEPRAGYDREQRREMERLIEGKR